MSVESRLNALEKRIAPDKGRIVVDWDAKLSEKEIAEIEKENPDNLVIQIKWA